MKSQPEILNPDSPLVLPSLPLPHISLLCSFQMWDVRCENKYYRESWAVCCGDEVISLTWDLLHVDNWIGGSASGSPHSGGHQTSHTRPHQTQPNKIEFLRIIANNIVSLLIPHRWKWEKSFSFLPRQVHRLRIIPMNRSHTVSQIICKLWIATIASLRILEKKNSWVFSNFNL